MPSRCTVPGFTSNWGVRLVRAGQDPPEISTKGLLLSQNCPKVQWIHSSSARNDSIAERTEVFPKTLMSLIRLDLRFA